MITFMYVITYCLKDHLVPHCFVSFMFNTVCVVISIWFGLSFENGRVTGCLNDIFRCLIY